MIGWITIYVPEPVLDWVVTAFLSIGAWSSSTDSCECLYWGTLRLVLAA